MFLSFKAKYTIDKYFKQQKLLLNYNQLLNMLSDRFSVSAEQFRLKQFLERPFSFLLNVAIGPERHHSYFVKLYKVENIEKQQKNIEKEFAISRFWFDKFGNHSPFRVIEPVWMDSQHLVITTRKSPGVNLLKLTNQLGFFPNHNLVKKHLDILSNAGAWLKKFQSFSTEEKVPFLEDPVNLDLNFLQQYLVIRMEKMVKNPHLNFDQNWQKSILDYLMHLWQQTDEQSKQLSFAHTDFSLSNVLVSQRNITVLDFGKCEINFRFKDLARFYHQLYLLNLKPSFRTELVRQMQYAFLQGYGDAQADLKPLFKIFFLIHQVTHLGKISRFWERGAVENIYNRFLVKKVLKDLRTTVLQ
ncbi:MAG TPA: hypothetical protein ENL21_02435 [Caldithrix abyssi]|uniref:Aminoglycoside phosphotransferase domain-containing protein n=1 Tax=Caldithrix abyssi TaxID=187145 RepID=A0A7V5LIN2_CALAY|nr:hypothetical protein [Caldithrix abyssi]